MSTPSIPRSTPPDFSNWEASSGEMYKREFLSFNLKSVFVGMKHAIPLIKTSGGGSIINNASSFGLIGDPRVPGNSASKGGIVALTRQVATDYAEDNIRINCICPGPTLTPKMQRYVDQGHHKEEVLASVPMGRFAKPEEIAAVVLFLASDEASFITGVAIPVDGGQTAH